MPVALQNLLVFFFHDTATTEIYTLSLHDALPIFGQVFHLPLPDAVLARAGALHGEHGRSEEHTSELQSLRHLVCRLLLEKNKIIRSLAPMPVKLVTIVVPLFVTCDESVLAGNGNHVQHLPECSRTRLYFMRRRPPRTTLFPYTTHFR